MKKQGHDETITIRISPKLLAEIDKTSEKLKLDTLFQITTGENYGPTRSAIVRFLIQVGIDRLKTRPPGKGPRMGKKVTSTPSGQST